MPVSLAICMSSAIPFLFKPVVYNDYLFVDGAINGGTPVIEKYKNFLEVFNPDGSPFRSWFYYADEGMLWCANYLTLARGQ